MNSGKRFQRVGLSCTAAVIVLAGLLGGCSTQEDPAPTAAAPAPTSAATVAPASSSAGAGPAAGEQNATAAKTQGWLKIFSGTAPAGVKAVQLNVTSAAGIGQYVSDGSGRSLYRFDKDTANPSVSNCAGQCAATWPPLTVSRDQVVYASGVDPQLVGFIERADGSCQITIGGWPVYYFAKDAKAGDLLGQGVGGTWFAVAPNGGKTA